MTHWFVGATYGSTDKSAQFVENGTWIRGQSVTQYTDAVNRISRGDLIAIKSVYTKSRSENLPFNNNGKVISVMAIKAIGVVTENKNDGRNLVVNWGSGLLENPREWYFYTYKGTVWQPKTNRWQTDHLIDFAFI